MNGTPQAGRRIAVDAMGGDHAPAAPVQGAVAAAREYGLAIDEELLRAQADFSRESFLERIAPMREGVQVK